VVCKMPDTTVTKKRANPRMTQVAPRINVAIDGHSRGRSVAGSTAGGGGAGRAAGCSSGGYHLPSDAIHQPGGCGTSVTWAIFA
jgi:hypothetical protein